MEIPKLCPMPLSEKSLTSYFIKDSERSKWNDDLKFQSYSLEDARTSFPPVPESQATACSQPLHFGPIWYHHL